MNRDRQKPFGYLRGLRPAAGAPPSDNPSGLYCPDCRAAGLSHCADVEYCGGMRPMRKAAKGDHNG